MLPHNTIERQLRNGVAIAVFAWNEEKALRTVLASLFRQTLFERVRQSGSRTHIFCVLNGCTDRTPEVAEGVLNDWLEANPGKESITTRVVSLPERGKLRAWNEFVHTLSPTEAEFLIMMDADIVIRGRETLWQLVQTLRWHPEATVSVDLPIKDIALAKRRSVKDLLSLGMSKMVRHSEAQLCAQLYCMRSEVARNIYMPADLKACEDGYIKSLVCTDIATRPLNPRRIQRAEEASHVFEAYTSPAAVLRNQKRQMIGLTVLHVLLDKFIPSLPKSQKRNLAAFLAEKDRAEPGWLLRLIAQHLEKRSFWNLFPGMLTHRLAPLRRLPWTARLMCLPAALVGVGVTLCAGWTAYQSLRLGSVDYWPKAERASDGFAGDLGLAQPTQR